MSEDRLARIENVIVALAERQTRTDQQIEQVVASLAERQTRTDKQIANTQNQITGLIQIFHDLAKRIEFDQQDTNSQIQTLVEESRDTRTWLRAAQENIQSLFTEIRQLWEKVNAACLMRSVCSGC